MAKRRELTEAERAAASVLDGLWEKLKASPDKMSLEEAADQMEWSNGSAFRAYIKAQIPLNAAALVKFAKFFKVPASEIFPEMASNGRWVRLSSEAESAPLSLLTRRGFYCL